MSLTSTFDSASEWVRINDWNPTDLTTIVYHDNSQRYVNLYDGNYGTSWYGRWLCSTPGSGGVCNVAVVQYNLQIPPGGSYDWTESKSLACEEMGHALGLAHRPPGTLYRCMSQSWANTIYDDHDRGHINAWYS